MRSVLALFFLTSLASGAETSIPQDLPKMEKQRREKLEWNLRTIQGSFDKVGKKDPRWDKSASEALGVAARMIGDQVDPKLTRVDFAKAAKVAIDAGCDDPLLVYFYIRYTTDAKIPGDADAVRKLNAAAKAFAASRYPAYLRANALQFTATYALNAATPSDAFRKQAASDLDAALALLKESAAQDERIRYWEESWGDTVVSSIKGYRKLGIEAVAAYQKVDARMAKLPEFGVFRLQMRGYFWLKYGWEARTNAFAPDVPRGGLELFEKRLGEAKKAYLQAWKLRSDDVRTIDPLLEIEKSIGDSREEMELWFERGMKADGDMMSLCRTKLDWLDPKWHGTPEEMLAFGRACRETKNWRAGITLFYPDAHFRYVALLPKDERARYLGSPEVWPGIRTVFDEYLGHYPADHLVRSKYAALAHMAGRYHESDAQFKILGDKLTVWPYTPNYPMEVLERMRTFAAGFAAQSPPPR